METWLIFLGIAFAGIFVVIAAIQEIIMKIMKVDSKKNREKALKQLIDKTKKIMAKIKAFFDTLDQQK